LSHRVDGAADRLPCRLRDGRDDGLGRRLDPGVVPGRAGQMVDAGHGEPRGAGWQGDVCPRRDPGAGSGRGSTRRAACRATVRWHSITFVAHLAATGFTPRSWAARLFRRSCGGASRRRVPTLGCMPQAQKSGQSHRSPLASRGNYWAARALRFAPVRSSGFRMPCRERAVELVRTLGRTGARGAGPVCSSVRGALTRPVFTPASRRAPSASAKPLSDGSWVCGSQSRAVRLRTRRRRDRVLPRQVCR
jgi:hypothetical protein